MTIEYEWAPRRLYRLNGQEVPSVTTVLGVLHKPALPWWGMTVGADGVRQLAALRSTDSQIAEWITSATSQSLVDELTQHKLTVNHQLDKAADRGVNVHGALERWLEDGPPNPENWPDDERGYVSGLAAFLRDLEAGGVFDPEMELMVGSLKHQYAGRGDLWVSLNDATSVIGKGYKPVEIPPGRYYIDLKTRAKANFYDTNYLQCEAYEAAAVECGYAPTDHRGIVVVMPDGRYQLRLNQDWTLEDFLAVRRCYGVMNERNVVQALREELDAKEVA